MKDDPPSLEELLRSVTKQYFSEMQDRQKTQIEALDSFRQRLLRSHNVELDEFREIKRMVEQLVEKLHTNKSGND